MTYNDPSDAFWSGTGRNEDTAAFLKELSDKRGDADHVIISHAAYLKSIPSVVTAEFTDPAIVRDRGKGRGIIINFNSRTFQEIAG